jgi:hypothetical protein
VSLRTLPRKKTRIRKKPALTDEAMLRAIIKRIIRKRLSLPLKPKSYTPGKTKLGEYFAARIWLILTDDPAAIAALEAFTGETQSEVVDDFVENTCWSNNLPQLCRRTRDTNRKQALRAAFIAAEEPKQ